MDLRYLVIIGDEFLHQRVAHDLVRVVADKAHGTLIPHIDSTLRVDTEDGSIGSINQFGILALLGDTSSNILSDAHHTDYIALLIPPCRGVKKDLNTDAVLGDEGKFEVSRLLATHGLVQNGLYSTLVLLGDEFLWNERALCENFNYFYNEWRCDRINC